MSCPTIRQNEAEALRVARAFRRRYALARRWRGARIGGGLVIGSAGIVLALAGNRDSGEYIAAAAALWLFLARFAFRPNERGLRREGALAQEVFDTQVFALPWNEAKAGPEPMPEDVRNWGRQESGDGLRDWYPDTRPAAAPLDALICQRATVTWARQDHAACARIMRWMVAAGFASTAVIGVAIGLDLGEYLLLLGLPTLPLALDLLDVADESMQVTRMKVRTERRATALYVRAQSSGVPPTIADCRQIQDEIYATRLLPAVPNWFYRVTRNRRQQNMEEVAATQANALPSPLKVAGT